MFLTSLLEPLRMGRASATLGTCLVCSEGVRESDRRMGVRGGGMVHRDCATYSMRRREQLRRRTRSR